MMNIAPGMKVAVRRGGEFFEGTITGIELDEGEHFVFGNLTRKPAGHRSIFCVHSDDVRPWQEWEQQVALPALLP